MMSVSPLPHILIVDDNPGDIELISIAAEMSGIEAVIDRCHDGVEAIQHLKSALVGGTLPALLLLDINMPRANGFEVLSYLHAQHLAERIAVVVLSTSSLSGDRQRCLELGALEMHTKPETIHELQQLIGGLGHYLVAPTTLW